MELKLCKHEVLRAALTLLIVPYGIETLEVDAYDWR